MSSTFFEPPKDNSNGYKRACEGSRFDLKRCLLESECHQKTKKSPKECLQNPEGMVPQECYVIKTAFYECKRSMLDMRTRFRGRKGY